MREMRALIVEQGWSRGALAATRALAAAGWSVGVASAQGEGLALTSRWCARRHVIRPMHPADAFVSSVAAVAHDHGYDVVFGAGEAEVLALSAGRETIPAVFPYSCHDAVLRAFDKAKLAQAARAVGIAVPETMSIDAVSDEHTPVVVKARMHARPDLTDSPLRIDTNVLLGRTAVRRRVAEIRAYGGEPELQVFHHGPLLAYAAVRAGSGVVADCLQRASRIWPGDAGASCRAVTVSADEDLVRRAAALFDALDWYGLAQLQFIVEDGVPRLIDLNGRFYGSLSLAVAAGANLPAIWAGLAVGADVAAAPVRARPGVRYQWGCADVRRAVRERRGGLVRDLADTAMYAFGAQHSVAAVRDPGPAAARLRQAAAPLRTLAAAVADGRRGPLRE
jgi:predicted ATP-grasp superfamily ATP-dependent carboligase